MPYEIPFEDHEWKPNNLIIKDNETSDDPIIFNLTPPEGQDIARLNLLLHAYASLVEGIPFMAQQQTSIDAAFTNGRRGFHRTIESIEGLVVPMRLAKRAGIVDGEKGKITGKVFPVTTGKEFAAISGFQTGLTVALAGELMSLVNDVNKLDPRFFALRSGSGSQETPGGTNGSATSASPTPEKPETAASSTGTESPPTTTPDQPSGSANAQPSEGS
jgi:hypothetical protein